MEKKLCLECESVINGRSDKKFCSDLCRNVYNNKINTDSVKVVRNINNILRRNRKILQDLNPTDKAKVHKSKLTDKGFDFNFFTSIYKTQKGAEYHFCYECGYLLLEDDFYFLVVNNKLGVGL